jgi:16S rRNA (guanine527-N7)-methyltransferase
VTRPLSGLLAAPAAAILGRPLSHSELDIIGKYLEILTEWNRVHRLVGECDTKWLVDNIVLDSLLFLKVLPASPSRLLDVGSGAGVPGIPMKIVRPEIEIVMVEARRKRASFLAAAIRALGLRGARAVHARIEEVSTREHGVFDAIVARCTARPTRFFGVVARLLSAEGVAAVSGPPEVGGNGDDFTWVQVMNPVTGLMRNFAISRPGRGTIASLNRGVPRGTAEGVN